MELTLQYCRSGPGVTVTSASFPETGTISFMADGTYSENITAKDIFEFEFPASCLNGGTCTDFATANSSYHCSGSTTCSCSANEDGSRQPGVYSGMYMVSGNNLLLGSMGGPAPGSTDNQPFCVAGSQLQLIGSPTLAGGNETFERQ
jgi:hypothetical protein